MLKQQGRIVAVTTTTGMASLQFTELKATTIHSWSGIRTGQLSNDALTDRLQHDDAYLECRRRITNTDVIIIDEIGMLSKVGTL